MITTKDFTFHNGCIFAGDREGGPIITIKFQRGLDSKPTSHHWVTTNEDFTLQRNKFFENIDQALDDLLTCDNPVAVRVLRMVFGDKYDEVENNNDHATIIKNSEYMITLLSTRVQVLEEKLKEAEQTEQTLREELAKNLIEKYYKEDSNED